MKLDWDLVPVGAVVLIKGVEWTVTASQRHEVTVRTKAGKMHTGRPTGLVEVLSTPMEGMEIATALAQVQLGGQVAAVGPDENGVHFTPVTFPDVGSALAHIYIFHGQVPSSGSIRDVLAEHKRLHDVKGKGYVEHLHDPDFLSRR